MSTITLAPMEGVIDYLLRELLTEDGSINLCVTEFIRVVDARLPSVTFYRMCPELKHGCRTKSGTPVHIQLLGNHPRMLAANALRAASLGALGIDLNFGCPAKTVNRHKGGAVLLQDTELLYDIVATVRGAVPAYVPVTAKMRLGYLDTNSALDNARAIEQAGASSLAVHARTKLQGYKPPAYWDEISNIRQHLTIPVIANGDIFTPDDARRCRDITGCQDIMIGRGVLRNPDLPNAIRQNDDHNQSRDDQWQRSLNLLRRFTEKVATAPFPPDEEHPYFIYNPRRYLNGRLKQWLGMMSKQSADARHLFEKIKRETSIEGIANILQDTP